MSKNYLKLANENINKGIENIQTSIAEAGISQIFYVNIDGILYTRNKDKFNSQCVIPSVFDAIPKEKFTGKGTVDNPKYNGPAIEALKPEEERQSETIELNLYNPFPGVLIADNGNLYVSESSGLKLKGSSNDPTIRNNASVMARAHTKAIEKFNPSYFNQAKKYLTKSKPETDEDKQLKEKLESVVKNLFIRFGPIINK
ncbi:MAG: hypothetical protein ABIB43_06175 [archaeon]